MIKEYNKLVRSKIPQKIIQNGETPFFKKIDAGSNTALDLLILKMKEEVEEVGKSKTKEEALKEMGDVYQVFRDLMKVLSFNLPMVEVARQEKETEVGPFIDKGQMVYLESVDIPE